MSELARRVEGAAKFENWCRVKNVSSLPAAPVVVAAFVAECEMLGIDALAEIVSAISATHTARGLADPTFGPASAELNRISGIGFPRSWGKEHWSLFKALPYPMQAYVITRERQDNRAVRAAQNEAGRLREKLKEKEAA